MKKKQRERKIQRQGKNKVISPKTKANKWRDKRDGHKNSTDNFWMCERDGKGRARGVCIHHFLGDASKSNSNNHNKLQFGLRKLFGNSKASKNWS